MAADWTPTIDPARRLFQVRHALGVLHLPALDRQGLEEFACNLERAVVNKKTSKEK